MTQPEEISTSARRAFRLVKHIVDGGQTSNLSELSRATGIARITAMRLLEDLEGASIIEALPGGGHKPGLYVLRIAALAVANEDLFSLGQRVITRLGDALNLSTYLVVPQGSDVLYIRKHVPASPLVSNISIGSVMSAHLNAPGRAILSKLDKAEISELLGPAPYEQVSSQTPENLEELMQVLDLDRTAGCAWSFSGLEPGIDACAAAVLNPDGRPVAAISTAGPDSYFEDQASRTKTQEHVIAAAQELTTLLRGI